VSNIQLKDIREILSGNEELADFIVNNLRSSLSSIGFSKACLNDLLSDLSNLDVKKFGEKWREELKQIYSLGFFQNLAPNYFAKYVVPVTPSSEKIIDVGCGTGILAKLYSQEKRFGQVVGIDINPYPEWKQFQSKTVRFAIITEEEFTDFLQREKPDSVVLTWTLHHMEYDEQGRYLGYINGNLPKNAKLVILDDSYSNNLKPENGLERYKEFMQWDDEDRKKIMAVYDWVANRVLAQREKVTIPAAYRSLEEWSALLEQSGFKPVLQKFIGFPDNRDINTPQSLIVAQKT